MSGSDIVFLSATAFALIGSGVVYLFAKSVERRHRLGTTPAPVAAREEALRPFERYTMRGVYESVRAAVRAAQESGSAVDMHIPTATPFAKEEQRQRESA
jgi:hypothetical protein